MGGGPPAGAQRVDVPDDNSVLLMPTTIRTAAVTRWVGRGNGPSRVTGASACPAAGDCYKNNYPHRALGAARITTAHRRFHTAQRMARRRISCIRSGFPVRRAVQSAAGCGSPQFLMRSGTRMVRQTPARARMSPLWQLMAHRHFGHWTAGRTRRGFFGGFTRWPRFNLILFIVTGLFAISFRFFKSKGRHLFYHSFTN